MFKLILILSVFFFDFNVSQEILRPITLVTTTTNKIITSFEPTTVTEILPNTTITGTSETQPASIGTETEPGTEITETSGTPIGTETEPGTEITEITDTTDTKPPPIGTDTTRTPTFRPTTSTTTPFRHSTYLPSTTQAYPPIPFPFCCGHNEFYHYTFQGVAQYCDPVCNNLTKICVDIFYPSIARCYCLPGYCKDAWGKCVAIHATKKHCHLRH